MLKSMLVKKYFETWYISEAVFRKSMLIINIDFTKWSQSQIHKVNLHSVCLIYQLPGGRLNKKDGLTRYGDSHVKDKTS